MRIGHYMQHMFEPGGIASYIRRVSDAQRALGHEVFFFDRGTDLNGEPSKSTSGGLVYTDDDHDLIRRGAAVNLDVLHVHTVVDPDAITSAPMPLVRTVHTHAPYCPSQGRFLKRPGVPCDRAYTLLGCAWGHLVNRCGSIRPAALRRNFSTVRREMAGLPSIHTVAVSQFIKDQMTRSGYPADRVHVLYLPAPVANVPIPPPADDVPTFAYLGRMIPHKGVDWLLRAALRLRSNARIELAGGGNQEQEYRDLAAALGLRERVRFHGWLDAEAAAQLLRRARALVFPSLWHEPGGTVAFEAMANSRAVIMSRVGGMSEVVEHGTTGLVVEPGDVDGLAAAVDRLAEDRDLAIRLGEAGCRRAMERHTLEGHVRQLLAIYERSTAGRGSFALSSTIAGVRVSVIVPTHRRADSLRMTLESLERQSFPRDRFDVTVVATVNDDAFALAEGFRARGRLEVRCVSIPNDRWRGRSAAAKRNYGARISGGDWIAFIDDDCVADPGWLAGAANLFDQFNAGAIEGRKVIPAPRTPTLTYKGLLLFTRPGGYQTCNMFYRREVFERLGGFDPRFPFYLEDSDLAWSVLDGGYQIPFAPSAVVSHPVTAPQAWRLLDDARRAALMPYLYKKHCRRYCCSGTRVLRAGHWLYLTLYAALTACCATQWWRLALAIGIGILLLLAVHVGKTFRGCRFAARELAVTALLIPVVPVVKLVQLIRGNVRHGVWVWT